MKRKIKAYLLMSPFIVAMGIMLGSVIYTSPIILLVILIGGPTVLSFAYGLFMLGDKKKTNRVKN